MLSELTTTRCEAASGSGVLLHRQAYVSLVEREPPVIWARLEAVEEPVRTLEPATGDGRLAPKLKAICGEPGGDSAGRPRVTALAVEAIRALTHIECQGLVVQRVADPTETLERLRRLVRN